MFGTGHDVGMHAYLQGHADAVHGIAWSKDGKHIATACEDMYVRVFDLSADVASKDPKFKRIKTAKIPQGVGFVQGADSVGVAMRGVADAQLALYSMSAKSGDGGVYQPEWLVRLHCDSFSVPMSCL